MTVVQIPHALTESPLAPAYRWLRSASQQPNRSRPLVPLGIDAVATTAATFTASIAYGDLYGSHGTSLPWLVAFNVAVLGILISRRTYRFRLSGPVLDELSSVAIPAAMATGIVIVLQALFSGGSEAPVQTLTWGVFAAAILAIVRTASHFGRRRRFLAGEGYRTLIVGAGTVGRQVGRRLLERPALGLRPVGFLDKEPRFDQLGDPELPVLGASWDLEAKAMDHHIDHVVIAFSTAPHQVLVDIVRRSQAVGLHVLVVPRLFEEVPMGNKAEFIGGIPVLRIERPANGWQLRLKYLIDRVAAALALIVLAPLLLTAALAVRLSSPGPILFRQRRVGLDGCEFDMLKFRTMTGSTYTQGEADAGWVADVLNGSEPDSNPGSPPDRRTTVGRVLRKCSVDELPQLINVLRGEMSLVGPRPERVAMVSLFNQSVYRYPDRHRMKGGMTGWAQVHDLRGETSLVDRIEWDNRYIQHWSLWLDLRIVLMTVPAMLRGG